MQLAESEKKKMLSIIKNKEIERAYHEVTDKNWWDDNSMTNDDERKNFLYEWFFAYYNLFFVEGIKGIEEKEAHHLLHQLKIQLDRELSLIKKGIYTKIEV